MKRCKYCGKDISNSHPNKKFCCQKHKDRFYNENNPRGYYAYLKQKETPDYRDYEDDIHPHDPDALGQE